MSKEVVIRYKVDSKGTLTLFEVVKCNCKAAFSGYRVSCNSVFDLYTFTTLYLHPNMEKPTQYVISSFLDNQEALLKYAKFWEEELKRKDCKLIILKNIMTIGNL